MKQMKAKEIFSIPNLMGYFRILLIPIFCYIYIVGKGPRSCCRQIDACGAGNLSGQPLSSHVGVDRFNGSQRRIYGYYGTGLFA